ncbi:hypothetical protein HP499_00380 [Paenarthrobacter sp. CM16]|uniref:hypothetical protein n=1 Tax=Paenarthrobacter sp. CM16 TaxID=2738447 RepID=UPI00155746B9|nr:hypothetical protein [Paenarthrobacter sp. CM16]NQD86271.1 hypothetical protein [Paenarthrobacter sp. CM16]
MKNTRNIDTLLRSMDAAGQGAAPDPRRSQNDLEQILSSRPTSVSSDPGVAEYKTTTSRPSRRRRRTIALGAVAFAATAGFLVVPALSGGDPAFATWTAAPGGLVGAERENAVSACVRSSKGVGDGMYANDLAAAEVAIAERRGAWTTVVLSGADGFEASCTTDSTAPWFKKGSFGSVGKPGDGRKPVAREIKTTQLGTGVIADNPLSMASGQVGPDVVSMTYTSKAGEGITATVSKGQFAFWLPGEELPNSSGEGVPVEVTYTDNTTEIRYLGL